MNELTGCLSFTTIVNGSGVWYSATSASMYAGAEFTLVRRSKLNFMASALNGVPSWNFTLGRSLNVYVRPSGAIVHEVASAPSISGEFGLYRTRPSYTDVVSELPSSS